MLLASDFDNTIYVSDSNIVDKNIKSITKFREKGNLFVIITGRGINDIKKQFKNLNIPYDYLICENGAMIFDNHDHLISATYLDKEDIDTVQKIINRDQLSYIFDTGYEYLYNEKTSSKLISIFLERKTIKDSQKLLNEILNCTNTYSFLSKNWINIISNKIDKGKGLSILSDHLENKHVIKTIGDAVNDISMIEKYQGGIMKIHDKELDELSYKNYDTLSDYIEELI